MNSRLTTRLSAASLLAALGLLGGCMGHGQHTSEGLSLAKERVSQLKAATTWQMAEQQFLAGDLKKAKKSVLQSIAINDHVAKSHLLLGRIYIEEGKLEDARTSLLEAERLEAAKTEGRGAEPLYYLGIVSERFQQFDEAFGFYSKAAEIAPENAQYTVAAAEMLTAQGKLDDAQALLLSRGTTFSHNAAIRQSLAQVSMLKRDYKGAVEYYREARRLAPDDLALLEELVRAEMAAGDYREAEFDLTVLLKNDANRARRDLQVMRAECLMRSGRPAEARAMLSNLTAGEEGSRDLLAWSLLGQACMELNDTGRLRLVAGRLIALAPERYEGYFMRAVYLKSTGDMAGAMRSLEDAINVAGANPEPMLYKALMLMDQGRLCEASQVTQQVLAVYPDHASALQLQTVISGQGAVTTAPAAQPQQ